MSQTTFNAEMDVAFAGMRADVGSDRVESFFNGQGTAEPFGILVTRGIADNEFALPDRADDELIGALVHTHSYPNQDLTGTDAVADGDMANVLSEGVFWCLPTTSTADGGDVYCRLATGVADNTITQKGSLGNADDTGTAVLVPGAKFLDTVSAGEPCRVQFSATACKSAREASDFSIRLDHAQATATTTLYGFNVDDDRAFKITAVKYYNATGLTAHASDVFTIALKKGTVTLADWDTTTGQEGTLTADTAVDATLVTEATRVLTPGSRVDMVLTEGGTQTLPAGTFIVHGRYL